MNHARRLLFATGLFLLVACARSAEGPPPSVQEGGSAMTSSSAAASPPCGDVVGAWSPVVSGLHARLVTFGSNRDRSALDVVLEIENVGSDAIELPWSGRIALGFAKFRLDDARGNDVEPAWAFGGNEFTGDVRAIFRPKKTIRYDVHRGAFESMSGKRALRIGAFWGRELPSDGSKRFLHATLTAGSPHADAIAYEGNDLVRDEPHARAFAGTIEVPAVCID
ncbi:MAG TPA: hypothetical protein VIF62_38280 [Labilithrix sp.]